MDPGGFDDLPREHKEGEPGLIRLLVADRHRLVRDAICIAVNRDAQLTVAAEAATEETAVRLADIHQPDVALVDVDLPERGGVITTQGLRDCAPECRIMLLSNQPDLGTLQDALLKGASGYLTKAVSPAELCESTRALHRGETIVPPPMLGLLISELADKRDREEEVLQGLVKLTRREQQVLDLLIDGADRRLIARRLTISPETARSHIQRITRKFEVGSLRELLSLVVGSTLSHAFPGSSGSSSFGDTQRKNNR